MYGYDTLTDEDVIENNVTFSKALNIANRALLSICRGDYARAEDLIFFDKTFEPIIIMRVFFGICSHNFRLYRRHFDYADRNPASLYRAETSRRKFYLTVSAFAYFLKRYDISRYVTKNYIIPAGVLVESINHIKVIIDIILELKNYFKERNHIKHTIKKCLKWKS